MKKGTKHSEETKKRMSETRKGDKHPMYGKHHSKEARRKIVLARAGQVITIESNKKRSETLKGREFSQESIEKMRQHALKRFSDKKNHPYYGKTFSEETKLKKSKALKGKTLEDLHSPEKVKEIRKKLVIARSKLFIPYKDTKIELKIQDFLTSLKIEFITHKYMNIKSSYQCDILIPKQKGITQKTIIECDGDFFHCNPKRYDSDFIRFPNSEKKIRAKEIWKVDEERTSQLIKKGFKVLRLWEFEIKEMNINSFKQILK